MGPEPMMRIFLRSLLGGIAYPGDKLSTEGFRGQGGFGKGMRFSPGIFA
jgi:hypothetical protein